jgi:hypothetical protein
MGDTVARSERNAREKHTPQKVLCFNMESLGSKLRQIQLNSSALEWILNHPSIEIFTPTFLQAFTPFASFDELLHEWDVTRDHFEELTAEAKDRKTRETTDFSSWAELSQVATIVFAGYAGR